MAQFGQPLKKDSSLFLYSLIPIGMFYFRIKSLIFFVLVPCVEFLMRCWWAFHLGNIYLYCTFSTVTEKRIRQGRAVILLIIRHYYYDRRDTRPAVRYCDRLMILVWSSETEKAALLPSHLYNRLPRPVITSVNPRLVISSTGRPYYQGRTILFFKHQSISSREVDGIVVVLYANYRIRWRINV